MFLIPMPQSIHERPETYRFGPDFDIVMHSACGFAEMECARLLRDEIERSVCVRVHIRKAETSAPGGLWVEKTPSQGEEYALCVGHGGLTLRGGESGIFWGTQTLRQIIRQSGAVLPCVEIEDEPAMAERGFMHDVTRGKVPTLQTLKELADRAAFYKLNRLQLYVEHSFAFRRFSEAWTGKDPLAAEDILEFDEYCSRRHIELVPTLATFGHLYELLSTKSYAAYSELADGDQAPFSFFDRMMHHTLNVSDAKSMELVRSMIDEYLPLFHSKRCNICCDETFDIGRGKSAGLAEREGVGRLYVDFLKKIIAYVQGKGKRVMFWGDIILKHPEYLPEIPKDVDCLYWNYGRDVPEQEIATLAHAGVSFYACPGTCGWNVMMNILDGSYENIRKMVTFACRYGGKGVYITDWGDLGHVNFLGSSMPGLSFGAGLSWNPADSRGFEELGEAYSVLEMGAGARRLVSLLNELAALQTSTWADVVCWHEAPFAKSDNARNDCERVRRLDEIKALEAYRRAQQIESELVAQPFAGRRAQDIREFICSARGVMLMDAAGLAIKKYGCRCGTNTAVSCGALATDFEQWLVGFTELWRRRNHESELYRIRETIQALCRSLREWEREETGTGEAQP